MGKAAGKSGDPSREALFRAAIQGPLSRIKDSAAKKEAQRILKEFNRSLNAHPNQAATRAGLLHRLNQIFTEQGVLGQALPIRPVRRASKTKIGFLTSRNRKRK